MFCILDLETTGINQYSDQPIEIGAILVSPNLQIVDKFHSYIQIPNDLRFSESARRTHGLNENFLRNKSSQEIVLNNFFSKFGTDYRFVAWNMTFDVSFFRKMCFENGFSQYFDSISYRHIDLQSIFFFYCERKGIHNLRSLDDACKYFGITSRKQYHNALEDAEITYELFKRLMWDS